MSKPTDISKQIGKYLKGELDGRAMHRLERQAQDDPFIMDALDGYAVAGSSQQVNLAELGTRLQQRVQLPPARIVRWRNLSIAASLVAALLVIAGIWVATDKREKEQKTLAQKAESEILQPQQLPPASDSATEPVTDQDNVVAQEPLIAARRPGSARGTANMKVAVIADANANAGAGYNKLPDSVASLEELIVLNYDKAVRQDDKSPGAIDSANMAMPGRSVAAAQQHAAERAMESETKTSKMLSGVITGAGGPLPGARVRLKGTDITSVTDIRGRFSLPADPPKSLVLDVDMIGYLNKQVKVNTKDSVVIAMKPKQVIGGGVITGYGEAQCCWDVYEKYLKDNAVSPDGKAGVVKLTFKVNPDNSLSDFKILKGLSEATDSKAIEIIKNGPPWVHDPSGKPQKVTLRIKFVASK
ncbi:hypothetical protein DJ568_11680 [Mucilaginibacter hurinus]|uniref:Uncharacterized protein n=1 Tax=Mucilaginibacter hurinus TaxID=2201324 RepID=A0A367GLZ0_9SPHI|nr:energy transducer TonB [Mucilaginibacter hurinus]RCH54479.1 hypothetical protein DJ568_11680 [Mucilaginibacter hurinus]